MLQKFNQEGTEAYQQHQFREASAAWQSGLQNAREYYSPQFVSRFLNNLGLLYSEWGDAATALDYLNQALKQNQKLDDQLAIADNTMNMGLTYGRLGDIPAAVAALQKARQLYQAQQNTAGEHEALLNLAALSLLYARDAKMAIPLLEEGLTLAGQDNRLRLRYLHALGNVQRTLGAHDTALEYYKLAIDAALADSLALPRADVLTDMGLLHLQAPIQAERALYFLNQALSIYREQGKLAETAALHNHLGNVYWHGLHEADAALNLYQQALRYYHDSDDALGKAVTQHNIVLVQTARNELSAALENAQQSQATFQAFARADLLWQSEWALGRLQQQLGNRKTALKHFHHALDIQATLPDLPVVQPLPVYPPARDQIYDAMIEVLAKTQRRKADTAFQALEAAEQARHWRLQQQLSTDKQSALTTELHTVAVEQQALQTALSSLLQYKGDSSAIQRLQDRLVELQWQRQKQINTLATRSPVFYQLHYALINPMQSIQETLQADEAMLIYYAHGKQMERWWLTADSIEWRTLPDSVTQLAKQAESLRAGLYDAMHEALTVAVQRHSQDLALQRYLLRITAMQLPALQSLTYTQAKRWLPTALLEKGKRWQRVFLVLDGPLQSVPFAALNLQADERQPSHYLIEQNTLLYLPAALWLSSPYRTALSLMVPVSDQWAIETSSAQLDTLGQNWQSGLTHPLTQAFWPVEQFSAERLTLAFQAGLRSGLSVGNSLQRAQLFYIQKQPHYRHPFFWAGFAVMGVQ